MLAHNDHAVIIQAIEIILTTCRARGRGVDGGLNNIIILPWTYKL